VSLTIGEFRDWYFHPVTQAYMKALEGDIAAHNALDAVPLSDCETVAMNVVAYSNRVNALKDATDVDYIKQALGVEEDE